MIRLFSLLTLLAWVLWFGGMIALVMFVMRLFHALPHEQAGNAAQQLFRVFSVYQLIVGAIACTAGTILCLLTRRSAHAALSLLMLGALADALLLRRWTLEMVGLDRNVPQQLLRFQQLHHTTTTAYTTAAVLLLVAGVGLLVMSVPTRRTSRGTAPA